MRRYLVLVSSRGGDALVRKLEQLAAREPSRFHVVVPREGPGEDGTAVPTAAQRLDSVIATLVARGIAADGEVGGVSVVGAVARAAEEAHYDALVLPVPETRGLDALDLDIACRLHQIDIPEVLLLTLHPSL